MTDWIAAGWPAPANIVAGTMLKTHDSKTLPISATPCWLSQVHGTKVVAAGNYAEPPEADAAVSRSPEFAAVVRTADCLPVLLCAADGLVFAAAHAGWRGLLGGVIENTVAAMEVAPSSLLAWLGPAISQAAFEVGEDVREAFLSADPESSRHFETNARGRYQADLYGLARQRLAKVGVERVYGGGLCTFADADRFHSYRRDPDCGRLSSFVGVQTP